VSVRMRHAWHAPFRPMLDGRGFENVPSQSNGPGFSVEHNARLKLPNPKDEALNKSEPDDLELLPKFHRCQKKVCLENTTSRFWPVAVQRRRIELWEESARKRGSHDQARHNFSSATNG
jgi:hypothetical protein